jgi:hypothetical protein
LEGWASAQPFVARSPVWRPRLARYPHIRQELLMPVLGIGFSPAGRVHDRAARLAPDVHRSTVDKWRIDERAALSPFRGRHLRVNRPHPRWAIRGGGITLILLLLLLVLILAGAGFALHVLWIVAVVFAIFWIAGVASGRGEGVGCRPHGVDASAVTHAYRRTAHTRARQSPAGRGHERSAQIPGHHWRWASQRIGSVVLGFDSP